MAELSSCRKLNSKIFIVVGHRQKQGGDQTIERSILFGAVEEAEAQAEAAAVAQAVA